LNRKELWYRQRKVANSCRILEVWNGFNYIRKEHKKRGIKRPRNQAGKVAYFDQEKAYANRPKKKRLDAAQSGVYSPSQKLGLVRQAVSRPAQVCYAAPNVL